MLKIGAKELVISALRTPHSPNTRKDQTMKLKFEIGYLKISGERVTEIVEAPSAPAAVDIVKKRIGNIWYCLVELKRIKDTDT